MVFHAPDLLYSHFIQKELVKIAHTKKDYPALADEIDILIDKKHELQIQRAETEGVKKRIEELTDFLKGENHQLIEYDDSLQKVSRFRNVSHPALIKK